MAQASQHLQSNPALVQFFSDVENRCFHKADDLPLNDTAGRDRAYTLVHLVRKLRKALEHYIEAGKLAEEQWDELLQDKKEKKSFLGGLLGV